MGALKSVPRRRKGRWPPRVTTVATSHHIHIHITTFGPHLGVETGAEISIGKRIAPDCPERGGAKARSPRYYPYRQWTGPPPCDSAGPPVP